MQSTLLTQAVRFSISGAMVTAIHVVVAAGFIHFVAPRPALANGVAFVIANVVSYLVSTLWSFSSPLHGRNLLRFLLVSALGLLVAVSVSGLAQSLGLHYSIGIACVVLTVPPLTFLLHRFWTYR